MTNPVLTNNTLRVKESNTSLILEMLKDSEVATRADIARVTGLSVATCGNILKDLVASGEILEGDLENLSGGRPARQYVYNKNYSQIIGMTIQSDTGLKTLQYAVTNLYGEIIEEKVKAYDTIDSELVIQIVSELLQNHPNVKAIGIGVPGFIASDGSIGIADIEELNGVNLAEPLEQRFNINVTVDRSPSLSAYGFYKSSSEYSGTTLATLLMPIEHPLGAGFIINDQIYKGAFNTAGEISYIYEGFSKEVFTGQNSKVNQKERILFSAASIIATINPSVIVLMGKGFTNELYEAIQSKCADIFPHDFLPKFVLHSEYSDTYLKGAIQIAIDSLRPTVKLVVK